MSDRRDGREIVEAEQEAAMRSSKHGKSQTEAEVENSSESLGCERRKCAQGNRKMKEILKKLPGWWSTEKENKVLGEGEG